MEENTQEKKADEKQVKKQIDENIIFIGAKPVMNYVTAVIMQVTTGKQDEIRVCARGKFISKAVDAVEIAQKRFLEGKNAIVKKSITTDSEKFNITDQGKTKEINISTIEIILVKG